MFDIAVGTRIHDLTLRQALAITDAALDVADEAGLQINTVTVNRSLITINPKQTGQGIELAYWFGLDQYETMVRESGGFIGCSEGYWGGVKVCILDSVAEAFVPETRAAA